MKHLLLSSFVLLATAQLLLAHPASINLFVNPNTNQLYTINTFAPGQFVRFGDIEVSSAAPGFGVTFPANNLAPGASLDLEIVQDLLYWDGIGLGSTDVAIEFDAPEFDNEGNLNSSPVAAYSVSQLSGLLTGMHWGNYSGNNFWEAHSLYFMDSLEAPHGIYGMVVRISAEVHIDSDPILVPFVYDPTSLDDPDGQWSAAQEANAIMMLQEASDAHQIADLNVDGHVDTDDINALVAVSAAGTNLPAFDLTGDGSVDQNDILEWLSQAGTAKTRLAKPFLSGDANLDGVVDGTDFISWNNHKFTAAPAWTSGDFNGDGFVDGQDFIEWNNHKFSAVDTGAFVVPEPMSSLSTALIAFAWLVRWRSRMQTSL